MVRPDEGGGAADYTAVDPGQIRKFAELLDEITTTVHDGPRARVDAAATGNAMFGELGDSSARAQTRHDDLVHDARTFWKTMNERFTNLASGTHEVATKYADLAELNEASSTDIDAALAGGAKKA